MPQKSKGDAQKLIDRILDFPYRKLFGVRGQIIIGTIVVFVFLIKFFSGIDTVMLDAKTCKVSLWDTPYLLFHKERILKNTERFSRYFNFSNFDDIYRTRAINRRSYYSRILILGSRLPHKKQIKNAFCLKS